MDANEITYGIEIETTMPADSVTVGGYHCGASVDWLPVGWTAQHDGSIRTIGRGRVGCEFVSPVLRGASGLRQIIHATECIKRRGGRVNQSTGVHVHVGYDRTNRKALDRLITLVANFEKAIFASTGTKSRENGNWSHGIQSHGSTQRVRDAGRYQILNLTARIPTVEFRAFSGSLNADKLIGYVRMCVGLVERSITAKRITNWTAKTPKETSPTHRSGEGQTALARLFYQLGWTKGRQSHVHGEITAEGAPDMRSTKRTMMKLARKYDRAA